MMLTSSIQHIRRYTKGKIVHDIDSEKTIFCVLNIRYSFMRPVVEPLMHEGRDRWRPFELETHWIKM